MGNANPNRCSAYEDLEKLLDKVETNYLGLNPVDGGLFEHVGINDCQLDERGSEFVRAGTVTVLSAWDVYIHSVFEEAFELVVHVLSRGEKGVDNLRKLWPACGEIIENEKRLQQQTSRDKGEVEDFQMSDAATQLDVEYCKEMLTAHCSRVVRQKALLPIFDCEGTCSGPGVTTDEMFRQLFKEEKKLSEMLIGVGGTNKYYGICTDNSCTYRVTLKPGLPSDPSAAQMLCAISSVHYILRCVLVNDASFMKVEFPNELQLSSRNNNNVKVYYDALVEEMIKNGRDMRVDYFTLLNVTRYLRFMAHSLMQAVAQWFHDLQPEENPEERECIWGYPLVGKRQPEKDSCTLL